MTLNTPAAQPDGRCGAHPPAPAPGINGWLSLVRSDGQHQKPPFGQPPTVTIWQSRATVVNTITGTVTSTLFLLDVRYTHGTPPSWRGAFKTLAAPVSIEIIEAAQALFTSVMFINLTSTRVLSGR